MTSCCECYGARPRRALGRVSGRLISQNVFIKLIYRSQLPHESVKLSFSLVAVKHKLTDLWGRSLLQNDLKASRAAASRCATARESRTRARCTHNLCYLMESVYKVVLQKSTPPIIRQPIHTLAPFYIGSIFCQPTNESEFSSQGSNLFYPHTWHPGAPCEWLYHHQAQGWCRCCKSPFSIASI